MNQKRTRLGSIVVLFTVVILCVAVFSALTVMTAAQDLRLSRQYAAHVQALYECESLGQQWLAQVAEGGPLPDGTWQEGDQLGVSLETDGICLDICLRRTPQGYEIQQWNCAARWQPQTDYSLWQ